MAIYLSISDVSRFSQSSENFEAALSRHPKAAKEQRLCEALLSLPSCPSKKRKFCLLIGETLSGSSTTTNYPMASPPKARRASLFPHSGGGQPAGGGSKRIASPSAAQRLLDSKLFQVLYHTKGRVGARETLNSRRPAGVVSAILALR